MPDEDRGMYVDENTVADERAAAEQSEEKEDGLWSATVGTL
jgi:hypothetical protein